MYARLGYLAACVALAVFFAGCSGTPSSQEDRAEMTADVNSSLQTFYAVDSDLQKVINNAYGYAVFPNLGKGGILVGGTWGNGEVYEKGVPVGYSTITQANVGELGGQSFDELLVFETKAALDRFKAGNFAFDAHASAVAIKTGAAAAAKYDNHIMVFTHANAGAMLELAIGGQAFSYEPIIK